MCSRYDNYVNEVNSECTNVQESEQNPVLNTKKLDKITIIRKTI